MECPSCKHATSDAVLLQCSHCGEAFERGPLEEFQHLEYLTEWLKNRVEISFTQRRDLLFIVEKKQSDLLTQLLPKEIKEEKPVEKKPAPVVKEAPLQQVQPVAKPEPTPETKPVVAPTPPVEAKPAVVSPPKPVTQPKPAVVAAPPVKTKPAVTSTPKPVTQPKPIVPPKPAAPPKPKRPPIDWKKVRDQLADAVTSGALLRALLYLGAFMIVVSATVLVVRFWNQFSQVLQLFFIASVPLMFYAGGWGLRTRLKLVQGGTVLTGIGAVLVAVDFAAIYQFGGVAEQVHGPTYWLIVATFCTALYTFTASRLQGEFFDYLTLISGTSILVALTRMPANPPALEWTVVTVTFAGTVMTYLAGRFWKVSDTWHTFARASRYLAQILIPASVFYVIFSQADMPIMFAFLIATIGYSILAWKFPNITFAYSALIASIGAVLFGLRGADVKPEWYTLAASTLALTYILIGQFLQRSKLDSKVIQNYTKALNTTGFILIGAGAVSGFFIAFTESWPGVLAMTVATLDLIVCAYLFKHSHYTLLASGLFVAPFTFTFWHWFTDAQIIQPLGWLTVAWAGLALTYIILGVLLRRNESHARWPYILAHGLTLFAMGILPLERFLTTNDWSYIPGSTTLGLAIVLYLTSAFLHNSSKHPALSKWVEWIPLGLGKSIFVWFAGLLFPIWLAVGWYGNELNGLWFGATLGIVGLAYIGLGQRLFRQVKEYRLPLHVYSYVLLVIGILISIPDPYSSPVSERYPLLLTLIIAFVSLVGLAYIYNRIVETILASSLFIWPFMLSLEMLKVPQDAHGLAFVLLAGLAYVPIAIGLKGKRETYQHHSTPIFAIGYGLSVYAVLNSIYWGVTDASLTWFVAIVPLLGAILYTFSTSYFKDSKDISSQFAWAAMITFAVTFRQALTFFHSPIYWDALAWAAFAALYMLVERTLSTITENDTSPVKRYWFDKFHIPLIVGIIATATFGLYLSLPSTLAAFTGSKLIAYTPFIIAQFVLVVLLIASARAYHTRIPLFIEPFIAFLPVTLYFIGFGESLFGKPLTTPQYAFTWTGLGIIHIIAAVFTDQAKERYTHGLYLGGYVLLSWAVLWSVIERSTLVWTFGLWILTSIASALLVHFGRHQTWDDLVQLLFGKVQNNLRTLSRNLFQWLAVWTFPIWCVILLQELNVQNGFQWLGLVVPPLAYLGLALWTRRFDSSYSSPLYSSAQFYTVIGLLISIPTTVDWLFNYRLPSIGKATLLAFIVLQGVAMAFYAFAAWVHKSRFFSHIATWLSISVFSMAWQAYGVELTPIVLIVPWLMWATVLLVVGYMLDKNQTRYAHGPYLGAYVLTIYALALSTAVRLTNIYALGITILLSIASALLVHFGRHQTWDDFIGLIFGKSQSKLRTFSRNIFQWLAAWAFPIWCVILI